MASAKRESASAEHEEPANGVHHASASGPGRGPGPAQAPQYPAYRQNRAMHGDEEEAEEDEGGFDLAR